MNLIRVATGVVCLSLPGAVAAQAPSSHDQEVLGARVLYVGNEGVLVWHGNDAVLFDGLFGAGVRGYETISGPSVEDFDEMFRAQGGALTLALASHHHPDHFGADEVLSFLQAYPDRNFLSTTSALDLLRARDAAGEILARATQSYPAEGRDEVHEFGDIRVRVLNLHHGRRDPPIENLGLLVDVAGFRLLHMGDTEVTAAEIMEQGIGDAEIDAAFVPYWLLLGSEGVGVVEAIGAREIFAIHIPRADAPSNWWGDQGSLAGTVEALEAHEHVTALTTSQRMHWIEYRTNRHGLTLERRDTWPGTSPTRPSGFSRN